MPEERIELFEKLFKSHFHQLYVHAYGWVYDRECAKDIVHDSFCYLWEHFEQYENKNLLSLLYTFVRSRCCDYLRRQRAEENYVEYQLTFSDIETDDYEDYQERLLKVKKLIERLPPQTYRVFIECVLNRKSYKEVAELLQISPLTVKTMVSRAYKKLRENLIFSLLVLYSILLLITFYKKM
jgi:RNA polymerase sigma-70 factor (ECF subfamily)